MAWCDRCEHRHNPDDDCAKGCATCREVLPCRVLVAGSREAPPVPFIQQVLEQLHAERHFDVVIHGGARGVDRIADSWARNGPAGEMRVQAVIRHDALWRVHDRAGRSKVPCSCPAEAKTCRAAGFRRTQEMIDVWEPTLAVVFPVGVAKGSNWTIARCEAAGIEVITRTETSARTTKTVGGLFR
jgi:hypothetical protein